MLRMTLSVLIALSIQALISLPAFGKFIPDDQIKNPYRVYSAEDANMTEQEFNEIIDHAEAYYAPIIEGHGASLSISRLWDDDTLNASASQIFTFWQVNMYGGLARHPEMTKDGFAMVVCHELGHHLAGFPFTDGGFFGVWAANEGQSDYFASAVCAPRLWENDTAFNATFRDSVKPIVQESCDRVYPTVDEQNLCYRINAGGESLARVLADLRDDSMPSYETPDNNKVTNTDNNHPAAQCRLDTTFHASLCTASFDDNLIPGKTKSDQFGAEAEREAAENSCMEISHFTEGLRPRCWFRPGV